MKASGKTFFNEEVVLDGNAFEDCTFSNVKLIYRGTDPVVMKNNKINGFTMEFAGPAANTIAFLTALYHGFGDGGKKLVEDTFENIRRGKVQDHPS